MTRRSPFRKYSNSTLTIEVSGEVMQKDPETGNLRPIKSTIEVSALIGKGNKEGRERALPALDIHEQYVVGVLVEPMELPRGIKVPLECKAIVNGQKGSLRIWLGVKSGFDVLVEKRTGSYIEGYFRVAK